MTTLRFLRDLCPQLNSSTVADLGETKLVIPRLVELSIDWWIKEKGSAEARKEANAVIEALLAIHPVQVTHYYQ